MATAYGYYEATYEDDATENLCFMCAIHVATANAATDIAFQADEYEFHKCSNCGKYIKDRVEI